MNHWEKIAEWQRDGFNLVLSITPEDTHPADLYDESCNDIQEIVRKIDNGTYHWFVARVQAFRCGIELGSDYLGGNLYESIEEFRQDGSCLDMADEAVAEAKSNLEKLTESEAA